MIKPAEFSSLPLVVILDLEQEIYQFQLDALEAETFEHCIDEILDETLMYLADNWKADQGVFALARHLHECYPEEGPVLAAATQRLAQALLAKLRLFNLYASDNYLHYDLAKDWINSTTPVLRRHAMKTL